MTQPQYLRGYLRTRLVGVLEGLPGWVDVRIRGGEPREIRSVEQLLEWVSAYGTRVGKVIAERDTLAGWTLTPPGHAVHVCGATLPFPDTVGELVRGIALHRCPHVDEPDDDRDPRERAAGES